MIERLSHISEIAEKHSKKAFVSALIITSALTHPVVAQEQTGPEECYRENNRIDLVLCGNRWLEIPNEAYDNGFYNDYGEFEPGLPSYDLHYFDAGVHVTGNLLYMTDGATIADMEALAEKNGIDPSLLKGGIATDSCRYLNSFAWIRKRGSQDEFYGPVYVFSCAGRAHQRERVCHMETVGEVNKTVFQLFQDTGLLDAELVFTPTTVFDPPSSTIDQHDIVHYPTAFLEASGYVCPNNE